MPTAYLNKESIANQSLLFIGSTGLTSFDDNSTQANIVKATYSTQVQSYLTLTDWHFAKKKQQLTQLTGTPVNNWKYFYKLPSDILKLLRIYNSDDQSISSIDDFERTNERELYSDEDELYLDYIYYIDESYWPHWFVKFVIHAYASVIAFAITGDQSIEDRQRQIAYGSPSENGEGGLLSEAKIQNSQSTPSQYLKTNYLTSVRFGF